MLNIHSIETFGTHDGPGIRLVVFTQGCLFRCVYCHNPDTQAMATDKMLRLSSEDILDRLEKQKPYFKKKGGLTLSGGEPTIQAEGVLDLLEKAQAAGFHTCLDTCGAVFNDQVQQIYDLSDVVMLDVKHIDDVWHKKLTGMSNQTVLQNAAYREKTGKELWLRYVLVPGWTDQPEFVEAWAKYFAPFTTVARVEILPYHTLGVYKYQELGRKYLLDGVEPPTGMQVEAVKKVFEKHLGEKVVVC